VAGYPLSANENAQKFRKNHTFFRKKRIIFCKISKIFARLPASTIVKFYPSCQKPSCFLRFCSKPARQKLPIQPNASLIKNKLLFHKNFLKKSPLCIKAYNTGTSAADILSFARFFILDTLNSGS